MANVDTVEINQSDLWRNVIVTVKVKRQPVVWFRVRLAMSFIKMAVAVAPFVIDIEQD
jgi:hypothetical protein